MITEKPSAVLIVVTINAEVFPVGAVRGIISGVPVFMMDSQKVPVFRFKLPSAFGADEAVYFERLFPVIARRAGGLFQFPYNLLNRLSAVFLCREPPLSTSKPAVSHPRLLFPSLKLILKEEVLLLV